MNEFEAKVRELKERHQRELQALYDERIQQYSQQSQRPARGPQRAPVAAQSDAVLSVLAEIRDGITALSASMHASKQCVCACSNPPAITDDQPKKPAKKEADEHA